MNPLFEMEVREELARILKKNLVPNDSCFARRIGQGLLPGITAKLLEQQIRLEELYREKMR